MPLAHTAASGGPNTEILLLGLGMVVLALVFFFQKTASRRASVVLLVLGAAAITGAFTLASSSGDDHHGAAISIASPAEGATVDASEPVPLEIELEGASLASESTDEDAGHLHVYVDGESRGMPATLDVTVDLEPGEHEVEIEFVDAEHRPLDPPVTDSVTVTAE
ncbi:MAG TPA: DUF4399 domain-containing protein [Actinomycetota bacterium]|nr:DUF4399 domain-containing protein [Actinomycetota bacterium]